MSDVGCRMSDEDIAMDLNKKASWFLAVGIGFMIISTRSEPVIADSPGLQVYQKNCKKCHGELGRGKKSKADSSQFKYPPIHEMQEEDLLKAMANYREVWQKRTYNRKDKRMAKSAGRLSDEEVKAVIAFIASELAPKED